MGHAEAPVSEVPMESFTDSIEGSPPSTLPTPRQDEIAKAVAFVSFGEVDDADDDVDDLAAYSLPPAPSFAPPQRVPGDIHPSLPPSFVVYERLVDTRLLRHGKVLQSSLALDLLALAALVVVVLLAGFHGLSALAAEPARSSSARPPAVAAQQANGGGTVSVPVPATSAPASSSLQNAGSADTSDRVAPSPASLVSGRRVGPRRPIALPANPY